MKYKLNNGGAASLQDGNYTNGGQYVYTATLAPGAHTYYFNESDGVMTVTLPITSTLSGPTVSSLTITSPSLAGGTVGIAYSATVAASGGTPPYTWSAYLLPAGLSIYAYGAITGMPTTAGTTLFTVTGLGATSLQFRRSLSARHKVNTNFIGGITGGIKH